MMERNNQESTIICADNELVTKRKKRLENENQLVVGKAGERAKQLVSLKREMDRYVVGQDEYKKALIENIYKVEGGINSALLVIGPTGCGKTYLIEVLKKLAKKTGKKKFTVMISNVSRLTEEGVKGPDLEDIIKDFRMACLSEGNTDYAGVIYLDEVDKLMGQHTLIGSDGTERDSNVIVQHQLMSLLDSGEMAGIPTKNILFVFGGAFYQLQKLQDNSMRPIGFGTETKVENKTLISGISIREDLIKIGMQREFLGRIGQIVVLDELSREELKAILIHPTKGIISQYKRTFYDDGISLDVENDAIDAIVDEIVKEKLGARSVKNIIEKLLSGVWYDCIEGGFDRIIIDKDVVVEGKKAKIVGSESEKSVKRRD